MTSESLCYSSKAVTRDQKFPSLIKQKKKYFVNSNRRNVIDLSGFEFISYFNFEFVQHKFYIFLLDMLETDSHEPIMMSRLSHKPIMPPYNGGGGAYMKDSDGVTRYGSLGDLLMDEQSEQSKALGNHGSMWLGTEDGK